MHLKNIALSGYRNYRAPPFVFSSDEFKVLKNLKNDNSIFIIKPGKGNGVVILNRDDYRSKIEPILSETNKFKPLNDDPIKTTFKLESTVRRLLCKLNKSKVISNELFSKLAPTGSRPGILYGLYPKFISLTFLFVVSSHLSTVILSISQNFSFLYFVLFLPVSTQLMIHFLSYRNCLNKNLTTMLRLVLM